MGRETVRTCSNFGLYEIFTFTFNVMSRPGSFCEGPEIMSAAFADAPRQDRFAGIWRTPTLASLTVPSLAWTCCGHTELTDDLVSEDVDDDSKRHVELREHAARVAQDCAKHNCLKKIVYGGQPDT